MNPSRLKAYFYLLIVVVIWGIAPAVIKFALGELPPFLFLAYRFFITTIILLPIFLKMKGENISLKNLPLIILISLLGSTVNLGLLFYGSNLTTSLDSSLISATSPILIILGGIIFLNERVTKREKIGILITFLGTLIITFQSLFEFGTPVPHSILGNMILLLSNIVFAIYLILAKKGLQKNIQPFALTFIMFAVGFITTLPLAIWESHGKSIIPQVLNLSLSAHLSVVFMAIFSGAIAYWLYQKAQKTIETSEASLFNYLSPIVTAPISILWLHEKLTSAYIVGLIVIALGVFLAEIKKRQYN